MWFAGVGAVMLSFVLQASALRYGPLALAEPLVVAELPLTFAGAALFLHAPLGRREWAATVVTAGGLGALVWFLDPHGGQAASVSAVKWAIGLGLCVGAAVALVAAGVRTSGNRRAALYAIM